MLLRCCLLEAATVVCIDAAAILVVVDVVAAFVSIEQKNESVSNSSLLFDEFLLRH